MRYVVQAFTGLIVLCGLGFYLDSLAHKQIEQAARLVIYGGTGAILTGLILSAVFLTLTGIERFRTRRAERRQAEKAANLEVVTAAHGEQVYIRELDKRAVWRAAHLDSRVTVNGRPGQATETEYRAWAAFNMPRVQTVAAQQALIPGVVSVDLLAALDSVQRCLIVGASDSGKTTLLQWLVSRRLNTSKVIVIDPHSYPDKYPAGCDVIGQGRNYPEIERALSALVKLMTKRYDEIGRGVVAEMHHSRITILIDEWRAITGNLGKPASDAIKALLTESRKAAFSVFVASHSDRARPLGLEGEYDLKDGFCIVRLAVVNGSRTATLDTGNGEVPAVLPGPFNGPVPQILEHSEVLDYSEPGPTEQERQVLDLVESGASKAQICEQVWGYKSSNLYPQIDQIIAKFGRA